MNQEQYTYVTGLREKLRHKQAELAYLKQQRKLVKQEVKSLERLIQEMEL